MSYGLKFYIRKVDEVFSYCATARDESIQVGVHRQFLTRSACNLNMVAGKRYLIMGRDGQTVDFRNKWVQWFLSSSYHGPWIQRILSLLKYIQKVKGGPNFLGTNSAGFSTMKRGKRVAVGNSWDTQTYQLMDLCRASFPHLSESKSVSESTGLKTHS